MYAEGPTLCGIGCGELAELFRRSQVTGIMKADPKRAAEEPAELSAPAKENLELLTKFDDREQARVSGIQLVIERISAFFGSPAYFVFATVFIVSWILINLWGAHAGWVHVDEPPFPWLQGMVSSNALLLTVAVLIRQNRMAQLAEHRSHLDLQINLLTEQKVSKIVQIVDALQRELAARRGSPQSHTPEQMEEMTKPADPHALLHAIKQKKGDV
jgi:uncharacterized membrane protein